MQTISEIAPQYGVRPLCHALERVHRFNNERLLEPLGYLPPAEYEKQFGFSPATPVAA